MEAFCRLFCCGSGSSSQSAIRETNTEPKKPATREAPEVLETPAPKPSADQPKPAADTNQGPPVKEWHDNKGMVIKVDGHDRPSHGGTGR